MARKRKTIIANVPGGSFSDPEFTSVEGLKSLALQGKTELEFFLKLDLVSQYGKRFCITYRKIFSLRC